MACRGLRAWRAPKQTHGTEEARRVPAALTTRAKQEGWRNDKKRCLALRESDRPIVSSGKAPAPKLEKGKFFYTDGGGIKIFGRSYPVIESVTVADNFVSPCGAGISVEHRGYSDGSRLQSVQIRNCIFRNNRCPVSGSAVDLLHGSGAEIVNCLFIGNLSNEPMDDMATTPGKWRPTHGSSALTLFPGSHVLVRRCTFTGNPAACNCPAVCHASCSAKPLWLAKPISHAEASPAG